MQEAVKIAEEDLKTITSRMPVAEVELEQKIERVIEAANTKFTQSCMGPDDEYRSQMLGELEVAIRLVTENAKDRNVRASKDKCSAKLEALAAKFKVRII